MASTRNKNTPGDYTAELRSIEQHINYNTYHSYGVPQSTYLPGDGLLQGRVAPDQLSHNSSDIESFLWGIGSTNLVNPLPPTNPEIKQLKSLAVMDKIPVIVPGDLQVQPNQRYYRGM
jgi:hypothetical protein|uniref:Uncharacterized protein n=1 Tax=viral metagenome TaxID=1070528 RepID=A0A6C0LPJ5_9ZZZZ